MRTHCAEMVGGPQDGGKIHAVGGELPQTVYVGPLWLGDGYAAWSRERCERFPECYVLDHGRRGHYFYRGKSERVL